MDDMYGTSVIYGATRLTRRQLEDFQNSGREMSMIVAGMLFVDDDVTPELADDALGYVMVNGAIFAKPDVRDIVRSKEIRGAS